MLEPTSPAGFDPTRKFVRVTEMRPDGFVEFEFAIGEPELFVEMILPAASFHEYCAINEVEVLGEATLPRAGVEDMSWNLRDATHKRFK